MSNDMNIGELKSKFKLGRGGKLGLVGVGLLAFGYLTFGGLFQTNNAGEDMVVQNPITGALTWHQTPGLEWRGFGKVTSYHKRDQFWFSSKPDQGGSADQSIKIRFNDGAHAQVSGSISWEMPEDVQHLNALHAKYGSQEAIDQQLVRTVIEKSIYTAGPIMSSTESYAARRNELLKDIEDQILGGVFETETFTQMVKDPISGGMVAVTAVRIKVDPKNNQPVHATDSPLAEFGINAYNLSVNDIKYDGTVEDQITAQQKAVAAVQIAAAQSKQAEQDAITAAKQGEAKAATAKWEKEVDRTKATVAAQQEKDVAMLKASQEKEVQMTAAQRDLDVANLGVKTSEAKKQAAILDGEGQAEARKLIMEADGALDKKLATYQSVMTAFANALPQIKGNLVPSIVMGGSSAPGQTATAGTGVQQLIDMLSAKTAGDLALSLTLPAAAPAKQ